MKPSARLFIAMFLLIAAGKLCTAQTIPLDQIIGIPFLSDKDTLTKQGAIAQLKESIFASLKDLQSWNSKWDTLKREKVVTIRYDMLVEDLLAPYLYRHRYIDYHISGWGGAWGYKTLDSAKKEALKDCKAVPYGDHCKYVNFIIDDQVIVPDSMVDEYLKYKKDFIVRQTDRLKKANSNILIDSAYYFFRQKKGKSILPDTNIKLTVPTKLKVFYPDHQQDYASACQDRVFYGMLPAKESEVKSILAKLSLIADSTGYNPYYRSYNTVLNYKDSIPNRYKGIYMEKICCFSNHIIYKSNPIKDSLLILPMNLAEAFKDQIIQEIWVEGACRYSENGIPLEIGEYARPLAILTNKGLFIGVQFTMPDDGDRCYISKSFKNKVISMALCLNNIECAKSVISALSQAIESKLKSAPFSGVKIQPTTLLEGELDMGRLYQPSQIFGAPYYEFSTYSFKASIAYADNPFYSLYDRQSYRGITEKNVKQTSEQELYAFLEFNYTLKRSVHKNGQYTDPDDQERVKFEIALKQAVNDALLKTCQQLKGKMKGSICEIINHK